MPGMKMYSKKMTMKPMKKGAKKKPMKGKQFSRDPKKKR
jgi:hypothetical protein